jgi:type IV secretory pathway VirB3-like protein
LRQKVLKALANPPRIFYVPYSLALLNFVFWFVLFVILMVITILFKIDNFLLPLVFLGLLSLSHSILGIYSKKDPQIAQIIFSKLRLLRYKIPRKLVV